MAVWRGMNPPHSWHPEDIFIGNAEMRLAPTSCIGTVGSQQSFVLSTQAKPNGKYAYEYQEQGTTNSDSHYLWKVKLYLHDSVFALLRVGLSENLRLRFGKGFEKGVLHGCKRVMRR